MLTRAKSGKLHDTNPSCSCGCPEQTLFHVLWECPDTDPPHEDLVHYKCLAPFQSVAHLLPKCATNVEVNIWKRSCKRAITIIKMLSVKPSMDSQEDQPPRHDTRGHDLSTMGEATYGYCTKVLCLKEDARHEVDLGQTVLGCRKASLIYWYPNISHGT